MSAMKFTGSLRENTLFKRAYYKGKAFGTSGIVVYLRRNGLSCNRLGLTASKKVGGACERNRARRIMKEAYRLSEHLFPVGFDVVLVAKHSTPLLKTQQVQALMRTALKKFHGGSL